MTLSFPSPRHPLPDYPCRGLNWRRGFGLGVLFQLPQAAHMLMLARVYPEIGAAVRQWLDMHMHEEVAHAERLLRDVQSYLTRREA